MAKTAKRTIPQPLPYTQFIARLTQCQAGLQYLETQVGSRIAKGVRNASGIIGQALTFWTGNEDLYREARKAQSTAGNTRQTGTAGRSTKAHGMGLTAREA